MSTGRALNLELFVLIAIKNLCQGIELGLMVSSDTSQLLAIILPYTIFTIMITDIALVSSHCSNFAHRFLALIYDVEFTKIK